MMSKDDVFWKLVQDTAESKGCAFFLDCGEGREFETDDMEGEDLSGWLIPKEDEKSFSEEFRNDAVSDKWDDFIVFAIWKKEGGNIKIDFKTYD